MLYGHRKKFIVYIKTDDICKDIAENVETRFDTSNYELDIPLAKGKNENVIGLMKDELKAKTMINFVGLRARAYSYLVVDGSEDKKAKSTKELCQRKKNLNLKIIKTVMLQKKT